MRKKIKNLSINKKLMLIIMVIATFTVVIISVVFGSYYVFSEKKSFVSELELSGKIIGERLAPVLELVAKLNFSPESEVYQLGLDTEKARGALRAFRQKKSVLLACLYTVSNDLIADYRSSEVIKIECPDVPELGNKVVKSKIYVGQQVFSGESNVVGKIFLVSDLSTLNKNLMRFFSASGIFLFFLFVFAFFVARKMQLIISEPIRKLTDTAKTISRDHNYDVSVEKNNDDEFGIMVDAFNAMLQQIHKQDKRLKSANSTLEQKVEARTADLQKALSDLQSALQVKENFISNMSHEIRTPGHVMLNMGEFARNEMQDIFELLEHNPSLRPGDEIMEKLEDGLRYTGKALAAAQRQAELLADVIDLKRMAEGKMSYAMERQDFMLTAQASKKSYYEEERLITDFPAHPIMATFDNKQVKRVIDNFISNALKYAPEGDVVMSVREVECEDGAGRKQKMVQFSIKDRGVGVPPDELEHIFGKFNESSATKNKAGGKGLGLAICDEVIQAHNGKIWAENNTDGKGTTFYFQLPVAG